MHIKTNEHLGQYNQSFKFVHIQNRSEKRGGSAKDTRLEETFTFMLKKPKVNTDYASKDMRLTTLGPVRYSITNEEGKKKSKILQAVCW